MNVTNCTIIISVLVCIFVYFYLTSPKFRYYAKFSIYCLVLLIASILLIPVAAFRPKNVKNLVLLAHMCQITSPLIGVEWIIRGSEYLSKDETYIVMANHQSGLDVLGMFHVWPMLKKCTAVAKKELLYFGPFGLALWLCGTFFIPRSQSDKSKTILNEALKSIKKENIKLLIFPEGTRRNDGQIHEFKKGGFHMALSAQLPILPIVFSQYDFLDHEKKDFKKGKVIITVLPPISTDGKSLQDMDSVIDETRRKMIAIFDETSSKIDNQKTE